MRCKVDSGGTVVTGNGVGGNGGRGGIGSGWCGGDSSSGGAGCDDAISRQGFGPTTTHKNKWK